MALQDLRDRKGRQVWTVPMARLDHRDPQVPMALTEQLDRKDRRDQQD
jgi:hypothetical protein